MLALLRTRGGRVAGRTPPARVRSERVRVSRLRTHVQSRVRQGVRDRAHDL